MNTTQITNYLRSLQTAAGLQHVGVYAADCLPTYKMPSSSAIVVNTDPHTEQGAHWVAFYLGPDGRRLEYFDSFGRPPHPDTYQSFLRRNKLPYVYNNSRLQGFNTSVCGHYCLGYLYCRSLGLGMQDFVQLFDDSTLVNDVLMYNLFELMYG